jgi:uncharacterized protein (TIRG00374 family)
MPQKARGRAEVTTLRPNLRKLAASRLKSPIFWIGLITSLSCVFLIIYKLEWWQFAALWHQMDYRWVTLAAAMILAHTLVRAARWRVLFTTPVPSFEVALTAMLIGQTMNYLLPARSGDVPRIYWLGERGGQSKTRALGTMAVEKVLDLILLVLVLFLVAFWVPTRPSWLAEATWGGAVVLVFLYIGLRAGLAWQEPLLSRLGPIAERHNVQWWPALRERLAHVVEGIEGLRRAHLLWRAVALSLAAWIWGAGANLATFVALGLPPSWLMALTVSAALRVGIALPSLPASVGVYEGTVVLALSVFGVDREAALSYGVLMHLIDFLPPVAMTLWLVLRSQFKTRFPDGH